MEENEKIIKKLNEKLYNLNLETNPIFPNIYAFAISPNICFLQPEDSISIAIVNLGFLFSS